MTASPSRIEPKAGETLSPYYRNCQGDVHAGREVFYGRSLARELTGPTRLPGIGAPAPVPAARAAFAHEPGLLQGELDEAVGEGHPVVAPGEAIEVADIPAAEAFAIQPQNALDLEGRALRREGRRQRRS